MIRPILILAVLVGALANGGGPRSAGGIVTKMTPDMIEQALDAGSKAPEPSGAKEDFWAMKVAMDGGTLGFYPVGSSWFTTPYSRVVHVAVQAAWSREKPVVAKSLLAPELHIYVAPVDRFSRTTDLIVAFIRPVGSTDLGKNKYPSRVEPAAQEVAEFIKASGADWGTSVMPWSRDSSGVRLVFALDALTEGRELVTVYNGYIRNCDGSVCVQPMDLTSVR